ncbi:Tetratricopeptide repeat protein 14 [Echinococcus granulosus]|nr:Tetratricopeptide repeat protein 14 [Echinococcus granulosus]
MFVFRILIIRLVEFVLLRSPPICCGFECVLVLIMSHFGAKLEYLLSSRAEIISRMHRPPPAEGNNLEELLGEEPVPPIPVSKPYVPVWPDEKAAAYCALTPPLETFMVVPDETRREQFFRTARQDDMLIGSVSAIQDSGLIITLLAYDQGPRRDFDGLRLTGFCPVRQLPKYATHGNALDAFQMGDKVRAFILDVHHSGRLILSMNEKALNTNLYGDITLGIISDDDLPLHYRKLQNLDGKSFEACLLGTPQLRNPDGLRVLCSRFGIPRASACSLLLSMAKISLPKPEMACELRRVQLYNMSMRHVAQGVRYFKDGRNTEALQCYNFAIEVENNNADAYVARGALYASIGTYVKAIDDLEKSLSLQPNHANAKNYLGQTLLAYACELNSKDLTKAEQLLRRALDLDPNNVEAREALRDLPGGGSTNTNVNQGRDVSMRSWSRSPSLPSGTNIASKRGNVPMGIQQRHGDRSPPASPPGGSQRADQFSRFERSRAALEQLVNEDRSRREAMRRGGAGGRPGSGDDFQSPLSRGRYGDDRYHEDVKRADKCSAHMEKSNLAKIVITRDRSGRVIRCEDEGQWREDSERERGGGEMGMGQPRGRPRGGGVGGGGGERDYRRYDDNRERDWRDDRRRYDSERDFRDDRDPKRREDWKSGDDHGSSPSQERQDERHLPQAEFQYDRRVYTPPKDAMEVENGVLTHYVNKSDLPLTSKTLQDRVQQRLKDIERRHRGEPGVGGDGGDGHWRGRGGFRGAGDRGFYPRGRSSGPRGAPRGSWRGSWRGDDGGEWRGGRRGNWYGNRDRYGGDRRGGGGGVDGGPEDFRKRPRRYDRSRSRSASRSRSRSPVSRSRRSRDSRSMSRSRSHSYSRSISRSPSPFPKKAISRARIKTPPLAPLTNRQSDSEEQMADVEQFVAQLQAKRQMEAEQAAAAAAANTASDQPLIGPQIPGSASAAE